MDPSGWLRAESTPATSEDGHFAGDGELAVNAAMTSTTEANIVQRRRFRRDARVSCGADWSAAFGCAAPCFTCWEDWATVGNSAAFAITLGAEGTGWKFGDRTGFTNKVRLRSFFRRRSRPASIVEARVQQGGDYSLGRPRTEDSEQPLFCTCRNFFAVPVLIADCRTLLNVAFIASFISCPFW
jgi:hypothetical protein